MWWSREIRPSRSAPGRAKEDYVTLSNRAPHAEQVTRTRPFPAGTRNCWRHSGHITMLWTAEGVAPVRFSAARCCILFTNGVAAVAHRRKSICAAVRRS